MKQNIQTQLEALTSIDAEQAVLGACLFDNTVVERIADLVRPQDFWLNAHAEIFRLMLELHSSGKNFGPSTLHVYLQNFPGYSDDNEYLVNCANSVPTTTAAPDFAQHVSDLARRREIYLLGREMMQRASTAIFEDTAENQLFSVEEKISTLISGTPESTAKTIDRVISDWNDEINNRGTEPPGVLTGLYDLDEMLGGFRPGKLYIVGGRPGMGKSTALVHLARRMSSGGGCAFISAEMEAGELPVMMITDLMRDRGVYFPYISAEKGIFNNGEAEIFAECGGVIGKLPIIIDDRNSPSIGHIRRFASQCAKQFKNKGMPFRALFVDYLQIVDRDPKIKGPDAIKKITQGLISIAKKFSLPVIAGCQINRGPEARDDRRPTIADLRESGDIENDAFAVILLYREAYYHSRSEPLVSRIQDHEDWTIEGHRLLIEKPLELIIAKNRRGPMGIVTAWCEIETAAIRHRSFDPNNPQNDQREFEV